MNMSWFSLFLFFLPYLVFGIVASDREPRNTGSARNGAPQKVLPIEIPAMQLDELNKLTGNFGQKALVGEGSYGRVFSATLSSGEQVAIKKLDTTSPEPDSDFAAQVIDYICLISAVFLSSILY